ncbi:MAG: PEP-utilizing enzyme [Thaumarchaeota archaeon]|nr:PEP-utilizing enzyme [Nitrososphaerota archaeon]MCL5317664.1 PEP-utilizing enzyme [Nitrososphaerota archaeon]
MDSGYIKRLSDISAEDILEVGTKSYNLHKALKLGFNVPEAFVLTSSAYNRMSSNLRLSEKHNRLSLDEIQQAILGYDLPEEVAHEFRLAYDSLGADSVSVRSSAVQEDLSNASYAGIYESYLAVTTLESVVEFVKKVWASSWSRRAFAYRERLGVVNTDFSVAVIVQRMVNADVSGIVFTRNPVDGDTNRIVITANYGLCETVASGVAEPDTIIIERANLQLLQQRIGGKELMETLTDAGKLIRKAPPIRLRAKPCLDEVQAKSIASEALKLEKCFGQPQDIEWSIAGEKIFLLQTRPISGLFTRQDYWLNRSAAQISLELPIVSKKLKVKQDQLSKNDPKTYKWDPRIDTLGDDWAKRILPSMLDEIQLVEAVKPEALSNGDLAEEFVKVVAMVRKHFELRIELGVLLDTAMERLRRSLTKSSSFSSDDFPRLLVSLRTKDVESDEMLQQLADLAVKYPAVQEIFLKDKISNLLAALRRNQENSHWLQAFSGYLAEFGHLSPARFDVMSPTYSESPDVVLNTISKYVHVGARRRKGLNRRLAEERDELVRSILTGLNEDDKEEFQRALAVALSCYHIKNDRDFYFLRSLAQLRRFYLEGGRRFMRCGWIPKPEDAFFFTVEDFERLLLDKSGETGAILQRGKSEKARLHGLIETRAPPTLSNVSNQNTTTVIRGIGSSPGVVKGKANVFTSLHTFPLVQPGEILVCPAITPAWAPLLGLVGGLVTDLGGLLSHGGILAREYGIPAVVGTSVGTKIIRTGQSIQVDGTKGEAHIYSDAEEGHSQEVHRGSHE